MLLSKDIILIPSLPSAIWYLGSSLSYANPTDGADEYKMPLKVC